MYFITINANSLLITAIDGLCVNLALIALAAHLGRLIDKHQRLATARLALLVQNTAVGLVCIIFVLLIAFNDYCRSAWHGTFYYAAQALAILLNIVSNLASTALKISIERDWVIVLARHDQPDPADTKRLAEVNSTLRGINLSTMIVAPLAAGALMSFFNIADHSHGTIISAVCFTVWNFVSCMVESRLLTSLYNEVPLLHKSKEASDKAAASKSNLCSGTLSAWRVYFGQGLLLLPSLAYALLYLTVLGFDSITLGYAKSQNLSEVSIAAFKAVGSVSGLLATVAFRLLHNRAQVFLPFISLMGSLFQTCTLVFCAVSVFLPGSPFILADQLNASAANQSQECDEAVVSELEKFLVETPCHTYTSIVVFLTAMSVSRFGTVSLLTCLLNIEDLTAMSVSRFGTVSLLTCLLNIEDWKF